MKNKSEINNNIYVSYPSYISIAVIKHYNLKKPGAERIYFIL